MTENRVADLADLLKGETNTEEATIAVMTELSRTYCAESPAAEVVVDRVMRGHYRYSPGLGWLEWTGRNWSADPVAASRLVETVRQYITEVEADYRAKVTEGGPARAALIASVVAPLTEEQRVNNRGRALTDDELFTRHATAEQQTTLAGLRRAGEQAQMWLNMLTASKITNIIKLCQGMEGIITRAAELDAHKDFINGRNGIIDLRTGEVRPHDPDMLFMHLSDGGYVPGSQAEPFEKALEAIPEEIREWYQIRVGQAATGHTPDDDSLILEKGEGENGKTVVMMALIRALGSYARYISHRVLTATSEQHPTELMDLRGLRLAVLEETPEEGRLDPHRLKMTIGTPQITARLMRRDDVTFETSHSLFITSNYWPLVDTTDHGTWRRLKGMDWPTRYLKPGEEARNDNEKPGDRTLKPRVKTDLNLPDAALTWIIEGAIKWYANDQVMPPDPPLIAEATQEWRRHCDTGYQFAVDCLVGDDNRFITDGVMADALNSFLISHGKKPWSNTTINTRLNSSLIAAGIHVDKTPTQSARVRANDTESSSIGCRRLRAAAPPAGQNAAHVARGALQDRDRAQRRPPLGCAHRLTSGRMNPGDHGLPGLFPGQTQNVTEVTGVPVDTSYSEKIL